MLDTASVRRREPSAKRVLTRIHRDSASQYLLWAPPESPVRIEYSMQVLREAARHERGVLYGVSRGATLRVIAARRKADARLSKLDLLGTFAFRERGEIFLTEPDLEHLERTGGSVALVVAGTKAGFFVHEPDGAIQTIKSYREFPIFDRPPEPEPIKKPRPDRTRLWISLACLAALAASLIHTPRARPIALTVREEARQLKISWTPHTLRSARLEISDGAERTWISVAPDLSSATYVPTTGDVSIRLVDGPRAESAHFIGALPAPEIDPVRQLEAQAESLRAELARGRRRTAELQSKIDEIISPR